MRTVFSNAQCAHVWAQQNQSHGRGSSVSFEGSVFRSYQTPIARLVRDSLGRSVALITSEKYSTTTAKHMHHAHSALRGDVAQVFTVPDLFPDGTDSAGFVSRGWSRFPSHANPDHSGNLAHYLKAYSDEKAQLMRVPCESYRVRDMETGEALTVSPFDRIHGAAATRAHAVLCEMAANVARYSEAFKLGIAAPDWQRDAAEVIARRDRLLNDPKAAEKRAKRAEARERAEAAKRAAAAERDRITRLEAAEQIALWRNGADVRLPWGAQRDADGGALVRIRGEIVQTSLGAEAPVSHVRRVLRFWKDAPRPWQRNTDNGRVDVTLGHFTLDSIGTDGSVRAGCHFITAAEVDRVRMLLGVHE